MSQPSKQTMRHRRRELALRAATCRNVAASRGYRHVCPLVDVIADYAALSDQLPYPSQKTMAVEAGVTDRTIRNWLVVLETLGIVEVYRSRPRVRDGQWTRPTNRYLLCDRRAGREAPACPIVRRKRTSQPDSLTRGNAFPLTHLGTEPLGVGFSADDPPQRLVREVSKEILSPSPPGKDPLSVDLVDNEVSEPLPVDEVRDRIAAMKALLQTGPPKSDLAQQNLEVS